MQLLCQAGILYDVLTPPRDTAGSAGCLLRRTWVYDFSSVAQERSCLSACRPGQKGTLRVTFTQGLAHPDPIPRGFGLQRKEQILSWQYTLLSDVAAAKREGLVRLLLKNHEPCTGRANARCGCSAGYVAFELSGLDKQP